MFLGIVVVTLKFIKSRHKLLLSIPLYGELNSVFILEDKLRTVCPGASGNLGGSLQELSTDMAPGIITPNVHNIVPGALS